MRLGKKEIIINTQFRDTITIINSQIPVELDARVVDIQNELKKLIVYIQCDASLGDESNVFFEKFSLSAKPRDIAKKITSRVAEVERWGYTKEAFVKEMDWALERIEAEYAHKNAIERAFWLGKPISDEVLKDYPEFSLKYDSVSYCDALKMHDSEPKKTLLSDAKKNINEPSL